jgi:hypothetical protein
LEAEKFKTLFAEKHFHFTEQSLAFVEFNKFDFHLQADELFQIYSKALFQYFQFGTLRIDFDEIRNDSFATAKIV